MIKLLIDTNVLLDIILQREPHFEHSKELIIKIDGKLVHGFITATTITDIYYLVRKAKGKDIAFAFIESLISFIEVLAIDKSIILNALNSEIDDFEDSIQIFASISNSIDFIITRNISDYIKSEVPAFTPKYFVETYPNVF
jgi:predicted nucleic acid-binding protein